MGEMLAQIPPDTPWLCFYWARLTLLQGFTKDPNLPENCSDKGPVLENAEATMDPRDDPGSLSSMTLDMFGAGARRMPRSTTRAQASAPGAAPSGRLEANFRLRPLSVSKKKRCCDH